MIRFVDLRGQGTGFRFAFWNTVNDRFLTVSDEQAWDTREELLSALDYEDENRRERLTQRLLPLLPSWADQPATETECFFGFETAASAPVQAGGLEDAGADGGVGRPRQGVDELPA